MKTLIRYFLQGALVLGPIALTAYVIYVSVTTIDGWLGLETPGVGFALTLALLIFVGFLTSNVIGARLLSLAEAILTRLPLVKLLYTSIKDLMGAFVGEKRSFDKPVAVTLPGAGVVFGFLTRETLPMAGYEDHVAVYFPQSYNFAGNLVIVPRSQVAPVAVASSDLMAFIVSGGVAGDTTKASAPQPAAS